MLLTHQRIADALKSQVRTECKGDVALVTVKADTGRRLVESTIKMVYEHGRWKLADFTTDVEAQTE
ncbi:MAG: hypothetical protein AAFV43_12585 [Planctomycetota bacterium]